MNNGINNKIFDKEFRKKITANPSIYASELDSNISSSSEIIVKKNTKNTTYVVIACQESQLKELENLSAASNGFGFSSFGTLCTTASTVSSVTP